MKRLYINLFLALVFSAFFSAGISEAQVLPDFSRWNGTLWKLSSPVKGYYFSDVGSASLPDEKVKGKEARWAVATADISGTFALNIYEEGDDGWCYPVETLNLVYFSGSALDFVASFTVGSPSPGSNFTTGVVRVEGELKNFQNTFKYGNIEPLGVYSLKYDVDQPGDLAAFKIDLKGKKVSKLGCTRTTQ